METHSRWFIYVLFVAAFVLQEQSCVVAKVTIWPTMSQIFSV